LYGVEGKVVKKKKKERERGSTTGERDCGVGVLKTEKKGGKRMFLSVFRGARKRNRKTTRENRQVMVRTEDVMAAGGEKKQGLRVVGGG